MVKPQKKPKEILLSKRANVFYLEHCRIIQKDERLIILGDTGSEFEHYYNLPYRNTMFLLLGLGTSITNSAARRLAESNVMFGFVGNGGSPSFAMSDFVFMPTLSEYRPTEYMQNWCEIFFNESKRLNAAKKLLIRRLELIEKHWDENSQITTFQIMEFKDWIASSGNNESLLLSEARLAKQLYKSKSKEWKIDFQRHQSSDNKTVNESTAINSMLDQGNYIAYGFAASALHTLGISFAFPLLHGKTRRGGLVFDMADLIKDAFILPVAFQYGSNGLTHKEFREKLIEKLNEKQSMDLIITFILDLLGQKDNL